MEEKKLFIIMNDLLTNVKGREIIIGLSYPILYSIIYLHKTQDRFSLNKRILIKLSKLKSE